MNFPKLERTHNPNFVSFFPRFIANEIDLLIYSLWVPLLLWFLAGSSLSTIISDSITGVALIILPALILTVVSKAYLLHITGQTFGKMIVGIQILNEKKEPLTLKRILFRETIGKTVSASVLSAGYLSILYDKNHRAWHDHFVNSYVYPKNKNTLLGVIVLVVLLAIYGVAFASSAKRFQQYLWPEIQMVQQSVELQKN